MGDRIKMLKLSLNELKMNHRLVSMDKKYVDTEREKLKRFGFSIALEFTSHNMVVEEV